MAKKVSLPRWLIDAWLARLAAKITPLVEASLAQTLVAALDTHFQDKLLPEVQQRVEDIVDRVFQSKLNNYQQRMEEIAESSVNRKLSSGPFIGSQLYLPNDIMFGSVDGPYMTASNVLARDFLHPEFAQFCKLYCHPLMTHRKLWEWAFIYHHARTAGVIQSGKRGLGFGVGREQLPSLFASLGMQVTASDGPDDEGWRDSNQYSGTRDHLFYDNIISRELFNNKVAFELVDMNNIPEHLLEFDFCWSSCSLEHLGSLQHGIDFVVKSVEKTLKIGGVACHTTELNLTSDEHTVETGPTVIYRKKDLERLCRTLEERGHTVNPLRIEPGLFIADYLVDVPPYRKHPCLKFQLGKYVSTSVGIVARRGR